MSISVAQRSSASELASEIEGVPGQSIHHDLQLDLTAWTGWSAVSDAIAATGAELQTLRLHRVDGGFACRCRLTGLSAAEARTLASALLERDLVAAARLEHLILKSNEAAT